LVLPIFKIEVTIQVDSTFTAVFVNIRVVRLILGETPLQRFFTVGEASRREKHTLQ